MKQPRLTVVVGSILLALSIGACGDDDTNTSAGGNTPVGTTASADGIEMLRSALKGVPEAQSLTDARALANGVLSEQDSQYLDGMNWFQVDGPTALADPVFGKAVARLAQTGPFYVVLTNSVDVGGLQVADVASEKAQLDTLTKKLERARAMMIEVRGEVKTGSPAASASMARIVADVWRNPKGEPIPVPPPGKPADPGYSICTTEFFSGSKSSTTCDYTPFCSVSEIDFNTGKRTCMATCGNKLCESGEDKTCPSDCLSVACKQFYGCLDRKDYLGSLSTLGDALLSCASTYDSACSANPSVDGCNKESDATSDTGRACLKELGFDTIPTCSCTCPPSDYGSSACGSLANNFKAQLVDIKCNVTACITASR